MPISNPTSIPGCLLWLDAADPTTLFQDTAGTTFAVNGSAVRLWKDKSGNNLSFSNSGALSTVPVLSTKGMQNNLSAVCFNVSITSTTFTQFLTGVVGTATGSQFQNLSAATIISVCQPLSAPAPNYDSARYWHFGNFSASAGGWVGARGIGLLTNTTATNGETIAFCHESATATNGRLNSSTYRRYAKTSEILTVTVSTTGTALYQNSRLIPIDLPYLITTTSNTSPFACGYTRLSSSNMVLNGWRDTNVIYPGPPNIWQEFIIYDRVLSDSERIDVENYIETKWNLSDPIYNSYGNTDGVWSNSLTWLNSAIPTSETNVWAWGKNIEMDVSFTAQSLRTELYGGNFLTYTPGLVATLLGDGVVAGTSTCVRSYLGGTDSFSLIGKVTGSKTTASCVGIENRETGIIRLTSPGGVRAGSFTGSHGATPGDAGSLFVTGPVYGGDTAGQAAYGVYMPFLGYLNVVGDVNAGSQYPGVAYLGSTPDITFIRITGNIYGSSNAAGFAEIYSTGSGNRNILANIKLCCSFKSGSTGIQAVDTLKFLLYPKPYASFTRLVTASNSSYMGYSAVDDYTIYLHPEAKDTRLGVYYGALTLSGIPFQLVGTMGIPDRTAVSYNTPVGTSLGVGMVSVDSLQSAWLAPQNSFKIVNCIGKRCYNAATIPEFGGLLAQINV